MDERTHGRADARTNNRVAVAAGPRLSWCLQSVSLAVAYVFLKPSTYLAARCIRRVALLLLCVRVRPALSCPQAIGADWPKPMVAHTAAQVGRNVAGRGSSTCVRLFAGWSVKYEWALHARAPAPSPRTLLVSDQSATTATTLPDVWCLPAQVDSMMRFMQALLARDPVARLTAVQAATDSWLTFDNQIPMLLAPPQAVPVIAAAATTPRRSSATPRQRSRGVSTPVMMPMSSTFRPTATTTNRLRGHSDAPLAMRGRGGGGGGGEGGGHGGTSPGSGDRGRPTSCSVM
jgi:hypothetical protein